jgi:hypothetical protein
LVVGYNPKTKSVIVSKEAKSDDGSISIKLYQVDEKIVITSVKQLNEINERLKAERSEARTKPNKSKK